MRKHRKPILFAAVIALVALGTTAVYAGPWFGGKKAERIKTFAQWKVDDALDQLDATKAQRAPIKGIVDGLIDSAMNKFADKDGFREELLTLWQAPTADADAAKAVVFARIELMRAMAHEAIESAGSVHGILDAKQRNQVAEFVNEKAQARQRDPAERAERAERFTGYVIEELVDTTDADDKQAKALRGLADTLVERGLSQMADREAMRKQALALWTAPTADVAQAKAMADARIDVWKGMAGEAIDAAAEAHGLLNAKQRDAVADAIRSRMQRRWH